MKKANRLLGLVVLIALFFSATVVFARWQYEVFDTIKSNDTTPQSGDLDTAIGSDGTIHVIYFKDEHELPFEFKNVFYAYRDEAGWHNEDLTQLIHWGGFLELRSISMGVDPNDYVYIRYDNGRDRYLLTNTSGSWVTEPIEEGDSYYASCSSSDSQGNLHIVYPQEAERGYCYLTYAYQDGTGWHDEIINEGGQERCSIGCSIALDSNDKAHILFESYEDTANNSHTFYYTTNGSGTWEKEKVVGLSNSSPASIFLSNMVLDSNDKPHFCYKHRNTLSLLAIAVLNESSIWHAQRDSSGWQMELVKRGLTFESHRWPPYIVGDALGMPSMALDMNGNPHALYMSIYYLYSPLVRFFPDFPFPGIVTNWNHAYYEP